MQSKNKPAQTKAEHEHVERVKSLPCSVCDSADTSECHEIEQGQWYTSIALCASCHRNSVLGWHGERRMWKLKKLDELKALNITLKRLFSNRALSVTA